MFRASEREEDRRRKGRGGETPRRGEKHVAQATRASLPRVAVYLSGFPPPASPPLVVLYRVVLLCCLVYRESSTPARRCFPSVGFTGVRINRLSPATILKKVSSWMKLRLGNSANLQTEYVGNAKIILSRKIRSTDKCSAILFGILFEKNF